MIGQQIGSYQVLSELGRGGMGEVYRAMDTKLGREVAVKVLPAVFSEDAERLGRFKREARFLAQLQHPNIASIYGLEDTGQAPALVMELVDGPTLAERLEEGALSLDETLGIARQITEALEAAHEKGIVHRDLKPQNIKAPVDGTVKVLDFGLAKALDATGDGEASVSAAELAASPTLTLGATLQGVILGTASYMAPEQAKGGVVDKRADIWSFGVVLYEMLSGGRLFGGDSVPETLAEVLKGEIDFDRLPDGTPPAILRLLRRCLVRNPKNRLHDIADARIVLEELARGEQTESRVAVPAPTAGRRGVGRLLASLALLGLGALIGLAYSHRVAAPIPSTPDYHLLTVDSGYVYSARFAPDDTAIVYGEARGGQPVALFSTRSDATVSRPLDLPAADVVGIADNGDMALILDRHHDGSWLRVGTLATVALAGGAPRALYENVYDADIAADGSALAVVRSDGVGQRLEYPIGTTIYRNEGWISSPRISHDGRRVAFADHPIGGDDIGYVTVVEPGKPLVRASGLLNFLQGVVWSADGDEVVASYGSSDRGGFITAFALDGAQRPLVRTVSGLRLMDIAANGGLLLTSDVYPVAIQGVLATGSTALGPGRLTGVTIDGISDNGEIVVGSTTGSLVNGGYRAFYRRSDGAEIDIGEGTGIGVSPDGQWAFLATRSRDIHQIRAAPTGPGEMRTFDLGDVRPLVHDSRDRISFTSDGNRAAIRGQRPGEEPRGFLLELESPGSLREVSPPGFRDIRISPDGRLLVGTEVDGTLVVYTIEGGVRTRVQGALDGELPVAWSSTSDAVFVWDRRIPARVQRIDLLTGERSLALEWTPEGSAEGLYGLLTVSVDARYFLMRFRAGQSSLAVARQAE